MDAYGAVLAGRRTVEQVDHWGGDHRGRPVFVPSHRPPGPTVANYPLVTYVSDGIASAMAQAKAAAGDREVLVHGAYTAQSALEAGVLDELQIHQIPVLFGAGRRLFDVLPSRIELDVVRVIDTPAGHPYPLPRAPLSHPSEASSRRNCASSASTIRSAGGQSISGLLLRRSTMPCSAVHSWSATNDVSLVLRPRATRQRSTARSRSSSTAAPGCACSGSSASPHEPSARALNSTRYEPGCSLPKRRYS